MAEADSLLALRPALLPIGRVREVPDDIESALYKRAPQALLRDLHRPVSSFDVNPLEIEMVPMIAVDGGRAATDETRQTLLASYRVPIEDLIHTHRDMFATYRELKALIRRPWADAPKLGDRQKMRNGQTGGGT